ncbi:MAG TPA: hypothetical protein PLQ50_01195 [Candidatus Woesebacteria bacterium]|nr:hypothetical protein [Candidatus Woesebacteria bacterium]
MNNIFSKKQLIFKFCLAFLFLVFLLIFFKAWQNWLNALSFVFAYGVGVGFLFADEQFLYKFYEEKIDSGEQNASHLPVLASRNFIFLLFLPFLSVFVLTSSGSILGIALVMAINFYLLIEMWQLRDEFVLFTERFLTMSKIQPTNKLIHQICWFALVYFIFLLATLLF